MIKAECVAASKCQTKIATFKVTMPRNILAEAKTHRIISKTDEGTEVLVLPGIGFNDDLYLSKNSASSRVIPAKKMMKSIEENLFSPIAYQKDHKGMQGIEYFNEGEVLTGFDASNIWKSEMTANEMWDHASKAAMTWSNTLHTAGITKQITNRLLEPFMYHTVLVTATEFENFFELRCPKYQISDVADISFKSKKDFIKKYGPGFELFTGLDWLKINKGQADIHMMAVAEAIYDAWNEADFKELAPREWHIPFGDQIDESRLAQELLKLADEKGAFIYASRDLNNLVKQAKIEIAVARCARLSYQTLGDNPKIDYISDIKLYNNLKQSGHWSPFEHVAQAMSPSMWADCIKTIMDKFGLLQHEQGWMANFRGWIQQRSMLENSVKTYD
jgi:hypothetical protein